MASIANPKPSREAAIRQVEYALTLCDQLGLEIAACHLQMALDQLTGWTPAMVRALSDQDSQ